MTEQSPIRFVHQDAHFFPEDLVGLGCVNRYDAFGMPDVDVLLVNIGIGAPVFLEDEA